jgi:hypothetical protein
MDPVKLQFYNGAAIVNTPEDTFFSANALLPFESSALRFAA